MSGPVSADEALDVSDDPQHLGVEVFESRESTVGEIRVRRALPLRARRTVGSWCFADHMGPVEVTRTRSIDVGPHPHTGLQTATWLVEGEALHRDSLGTEQLLRAGELNLMTAGNGVSHSEEATGSYAGTLDGIQLWIAQPEATRHGPPAFEHHPELPALELGTSRARVIVGELEGVSSPARRDTDHMAVELDMRPGTTVVPLRDGYEHALIVLRGRVEVDGEVVEPGRFAVAGEGRDEVGIVAAEPTVAILLGGVPFPEELVMWWNFVGRSRDEVAAAGDDWNAFHERFGSVQSPLGRIPAPRPHWRRS